MTKLLSPLVLALATVFLAGCELYFGGGGGDRWTYCAADGYYMCDGDDCEWAGARCPSDPEYTCSDHADCAAGCYCSSDGICEEAGFCGDDTDCPTGYHCEVDRASCVPDVPPTCSSSADCEPGEYCTESGSCEASCTCTTDAEAQAAGFGYCDEARGTCEPTPAGGSCAAEVTCNTRAPQCAAGEVPLVVEGCYTGECQAIAACDIAPACEAFQHEGDCLADTIACSAVYTGINCTNSNGTTCQAGDTGCTCESFNFAECRTRPQ